MAEDKSPGSGIAREIAGDGSTLIRDERCAYSFRRLAAGVIEIRQVGTDSGQFGTAIIDEVALGLVRERPIELLLDVDEGAIMSVAVITAWARFLELNRENLRRLRILVTSKPAALAMGLVRHLSKTGDLIRIHEDRDSYEARKATLAFPQRSGD